MSQWQPPYAYAPAPQQPPRRSWPRRHKILSALIAAAAVIVVMAVLSAIPAPGGGTAPGIAPAAATGSRACASYRALTSRQWLQIAKDPDAHTGECIIVFGEISQFDSATGSDAFLADAGGVMIRPQFGFADYPTSVALQGTPGQLAALVEGDLFAAKVTVGGHISYNNTLGGQTTVPLLRVHSISRTGHLSS